MSEWQPIETCPIETPVLVVDKGVVQHAIVQTYDDGSWSCLADGESWEDFHPSHWQPLPPPPK
jgi:hypothetical protein